MILETETLILRKPGPQDVAATVDFFMSPRSSMAGGPLTQGKAWRQFAAEVGHWDLVGCGMWAVTPKGGDDAIAGLVGPWCPMDWPEKELGWVIFDGFEGKGIAFEAATAARRDAFERLGWETAVSYIDPENVRSIALAERLGATLDQSAPQPKPETPCLVYRHPTPSEVTS